MFQNNASKEKSPLKSSMSIMRGKELADADFELLSFFVPFFVSGYD